MALQAWSKIKQRYRRVEGAGGRRGRRARGGLSVAEAAARSAARPASCFYSAKTLLNPFQINHFSATGIQDGIWSTSIEDYTVLLVYNLSFKAFITFSIRKQHFFFR